MTLEVQVLPPSGPAGRPSRPVQPARVPARLVCVRCGTAVAYEAVWGRSTPHAPCHDTAAGCRIAGAGARRQRPGPGARSRARGRHPSGRRGQLRSRDREARRGRASAEGRRQQAATALSRLSLPGDRAPAAQPGAGGARALRRRGEGRHGPDALRVRVPAAGDQGLRGGKEGSAGRDGEPEDDAATGPAPRPGEAAHRRPCQAGRSLLRGGEGGCLLDRAGAAERRPGARLRSRQRVRGDGAALGRACAAKRRSPDC